MKFPPPPTIHAASTTPTPPRVHLLYGDVLRIVATLFVVGLHVVVLCVPLASGQAMTLLSESVHAVSRWAVPCFIMLSGALLIAPSDESAVAFYRKRFRRVGVPLLFWSVVSVLLCHVWLSDAAGIGQILKHSLDATLRGQPDIHLWFVFTVLGLYAVTPVIRLLWKHTGRRQQWLMTLFCLFVAFGATISSGLLNDGGWRTPALPNLFSEWVYFLGYFLIGALLRDLRLTRLALYLCVAGIVISVTSIFGGYYFTVRHDELLRAQAFFHNYLSPLVFIGAVPVFLLFSNLLADRSAPSPLLTTLAGATFGVYLMHLVVVRLLLTSDLVVSQLSAKPFQTTAGLVLVTLLVSFAVTLCITRIPRLRAIVGA
jgi:surface polysaccharide O-acyltransferase-like enzyme